MKDYSYGELRWRPIEHILEQFTVNELQAILGVGHGTAGLLKQDPWAINTRLGHEDEGKPLLTMEREKTIRAYLEERAAEEVVG